MSKSIVNDEPVSEWIERVRARSEFSTHKLWTYSLQQLTRMAAHLLRKRQSADYDNDDIAAETISAVLLALRENRYPNLKSRTDFWRMLTATAKRKIVDKNRRGAAKKRGGNAGPNGEPAFLVSGDALGDLPSGEPSAEVVEVAVESCTALLALLDARCKHAFLARLEGKSCREIAAELSCAPTTVERYFRIIRETWKEHCADENELDVGGASPD